MRLAERMTEKQLKAVTKTRACGGVPGLVVKVVKLKDGSLANTSFSGNQPSIGYLHSDAIRRCRSQTPSKRPLSGK